MQIAVIGGGLAGVAAAVYLKRSGITDFVVYERSAGVGGVWFDNRYPGAACDVPSDLYQYSFALKSDWSRVHAPQFEILSYIEGVVDSFNLRPHFKLQTAVTELRWSDDSTSWSLHTNRGECARYDVVVSCVGLLNQPNIPDLPGLDRFSGQVLHTARWKPVDLNGKRVAVVGAGATAVQIIPQIAPLASSLLVFQRQPAWVLPNPEGNRAYSNHETRNLRQAHLASRLKRYKEFWQRELMAGAIRPASYFHKQRTVRALAWLERTVRNPEVRQMLTPKYPFNCKRPTRDPNYLNVFNRDNVSLVPYEAIGLTEDGVIASDGVTRKADVLILATGFTATKFMSTMRIYGKGGTEIHESWETQGGPEAFLGVSTAGFPNFFMLYGPNSNATANSMTFILECQAAHVARLITKMRKRRVSVIDVRSSVQSRFNEWLQDRMKRTAYVSGCSNYYTTANGKVVTNWPASATAYYILLRVLGGQMRLVYSLLPRRKSRLRRICRAAGSGLRLKRTS